MSVPGALVVAGVAIAVLAGAYAVMREGDRPPSRDTVPPPGGTVPIARDAGVAQPPPLPPSLDLVPDAGIAADAMPIDAAIDAPGPAATGAAAFADERRDTTWAPAMERTIERALARQAGAQLQRVECRAQQCRLDYEGSEALLAETMAALESADGLRALARTVTLSIERGAGGKMQLHAYAAFAR